MQKFCVECGYKFEKSYKFCPECGVKVSGNPNRNNSNSARKSNNNVSNISSEKNLDPKVLYGIIAVGLVIALTIILSSGVLDSNKVNTAVNQPPPKTSSGVDLNNMQTINNLEEKVKLNSEDYKSLLELAHLKNDSGLFEAAIQNYKTYLVKNPKDADARVDMGVCYFNLKDYTTAIKEMETAIKYVPNHQIAHLNLGIVNLSAGNVDVSKDWFKKAYEINPASDVGKRAEELLKNH
jgi:tetratricopeptide (TPR) repeat protein